MYKYRSFHWKRTVPLTLLLLVLGYGVFFYAKHQEIIANFRPYYYQSYLAAIQYKLSHPVEARTEVITSNSVPVLVYHGIVPGVSKGEDTSVKEFAAQMVALKKAGYHTVSIDQYNKFVYEGHALPRRSFLLTFDDGRKDSYYASQPLLEALNFRATMFVITGKSLGDRSSVYYLSKNELKAMKASGRWDLQAHTQSGHDVIPVNETDKAPFFANKLWITGQKRFETDAEYRDRVRADLIGAKEDLKRELGITPVAFAVPFGDIGENTTNYSGAKTVLMEELSATYPLTFVQVMSGRPYSQNYLGSKQAFSTRIEPKPDWSAERLLSAIASGDSKSLPYSATPKLSDGWRIPWGNGINTSNGITFQAGAKTTGATLTLDGTYDWKDYTALTTVHMTKGANIRTLMRQQDGNTYLACSYSADKIQIQISKNGGSETLASQNAVINLTKPTLLTSTVKGRSITCSAPGVKPISVSFSDPFFTGTGGIGYVVYDEKANNAEGVITKLEVSVAR